MPLAQSGGFFFAVWGMAMRIQRVLPWLGAAAIWVAALWGFLHILDAHTRQPDADSITLVAYSAAVLALAGWMVQALVSVRASRKQHSINVLFQSRMSAEYQGHIKTIRDAYPDRGVAFLFEELKRPEKQDAYRSISFMLNYYEFISVGIWHGDLDESIMRECIRSQFLDFVRRSRDVIARVREEDGDGKPSPARQLIFKGICRLNERWSADLYRVTGQWPGGKA